MSPSTSHRRPAVLATLVAALLLALLPQPQAATAVDTGTISGRVLHQLPDDGGVAQFGLIDVYDDSKSPPEYLQTVEADGNGNYSVDLAPGLYGLVFYNSDDGGANFLGFFPELYSEQPLYGLDPTLIKLEAGQTVTANSNLAPLFFDMFSTPFTDDIFWLRNAGITFGCNPSQGNTNYCPDRSVTRGQMAAFLVRAFGLSKIDPDIEFDDIDGSPFANDIRRLATAGITRGCNPAQGNTSFCPNDVVTRGQMAAFLVRAFNMKATDPSLDFADDDDSVFEGDINKLATAEVTRGCNPAQGNTNYCPNDAVTRGQMAAFLRRAAAWAGDETAKLDASSMAHPAGERPDLGAR